MALYVWYDGKDLAENFGITKNVLKTDEDVEIIENDIDSNENIEKLDLDSVDIEAVDGPSTENELKQIQEFFKANTRVKGMQEFNQEQYKQEQENFNQYILLNRDARKAYEKKYNVMSVENDLGVSYVKIPDALFGNVSMDIEEDIYKQRQEEIHGNLYDIFSNL